ncbi:MAG: hypothetical protein M1572_03815 [Gammaproteobacteria bacterium]|nr:hypothetical protein [Gammaproteobacteria bacterium]
MTLPVCWCCPWCHRNHARLTPVGYDLASLFAPVGCWCQSICGFGAVGFLAVFGVGGVTLTMLGLHLLAMTLPVCLHSWAVALILPVLSLVLLVVLSSLPCKACACWL